jgi:hypothetical protein
MNFRNLLAIGSLIALAAPLPLAFWGAVRLFTMTAADASAIGAADRLSSAMNAYGSAVVAAIPGSVLAGFCLDGLRMRPRWYLRSLCVIGFLWLFNFPAGTLFGGGLLFYLLVKHLAERRTARDKGVNGA